MGKIKRQYLAMGPFCWGKGNTTSEAINNMKKHWPESVGEYKRENIKMYKVHPDTEVQADGSFRYPKTHPPIETEEE